MTQNVQIKNYLKNKTKINTNDEFVLINEFFKINNFNDSQYDKSISIEDNIKNKLIKKYKNSFLLEQEFGVSIPELNHIGGDVLVRWYEQVLIGNG